MNEAALRTITIDCEYLRPRFAAAYFLRQGDRAAFVDNNTVHAVPRLLAALSAEGLTPEQVDWVIVTHVHLDHASGSAELMRACPRATLLCHPRAAPHLIDPSRLIASARQVYGAETFARLYGEPAPIPADRVRAVNDGEIVAWGARPLRFLHARGHANHHVCIDDPATRSVFTGDAFGLAYPALQSGGLFIFPSTSPTDFDGPEARAALDRIVATGAERAWLTHFGAVTDLAGAREQLRAHLEFSERVLDEAVQSSLPDDALDAFCLDRLRPHLETALRGRGVALEDAARELLRLDLELNAQGLAHVARKRRSKSSAKP